MLVTDTRESVSYLILVLSPSEISFLHSRVLRVCICPIHKDFGWDPGGRVGQEKADLGEEGN